MLRNTANGSEKDCKTKREWVEVCAILGTNQRKCTDTANRRLRQQVDVSQYPTGNSSGKETYISLCLSDCDAETLLVDKKT